MATVTALFNTNIDNVAYQFVCVGPDRRVQTSPDGETWTARTWTTGTNYQSMAFGKDILVIVASNANTANMIYTNIDGYTAPTARTHVALGASVGWYDVAFGNDIWVAVAGGANNQTTGTSSNSVIWTLNTTSLTSADYRSIIYAESKFVTLAYSDGTNNCSDYVRYGTDGVSWSNGSGLPKSKWRSIAYDATLSRFVAVSIMPLLVNATNATTLAFATGTNTITRAAGNFTTDTYFVGGTIVVSGTASNNGTYTIATVGTTTITVNEALATESANASAVITPIKGSAYSDDGITWTVGSPTTYLEPSNWISVASNGLGRFMAISNTASRDLVAYSDDGINWTSIRLPQIATWTDITYGNGRWVATAASYVAYSDDNGVNWAVIGVGAFAWNDIHYIPIRFHTNDTLTIDRGAVVTCNTDQTAGWSGITITNGTLRIENASTSNAIRFVTARTSGAAVQAITPASGLGIVEIEGDWIQIGTGDATSSQTMTVPYTDYVPCVWVETGVGTNIYEIWLNVSSAYGGTLKQYADGLLDVSTGQRGKFFVQTPSATQDKYITVTGTVGAGLMTITVDDTTGVYQGASITGQGIPASTVVEEVVDGTTLRINQQPVMVGTTAAYTNVPLRIINPYSSQFTNQIVFGDGTNGNTLTNDVKVRVPNIMLTSDTPANLHTSSQLLGLSFVMTSGGNLSIDTCLMDECYHNLNQTQSLLLRDVGLHIRPAITEVYDLTIDSVGMGMPAVRRFNASNIWTARDIRDTLTNSLLMNYISGAVIEDLVMVLQSPHAITAASATAPTGMLNLANSDSLLVSNVRMYSLNTTRAYQCGLAFPAPITNSDFTNIETYGCPFMNIQFSSNNTFNDLIGSETMFSFSHNYTAGTRVTYDPSTQADMVDGTKYYFKSRTFFTRDRTEYTESRVYSATPFKGSTYFSDYVTAYCNAPQSVTFGWTHRTPMYTAETMPASNADAKNFLEIYRDTSPGFTPTLSKKVCGLNPAISIGIPTKAVWANELRTIAFTNIAITASGGRTIQFNAGAKTIVASSGDFASDGITIGDKVVVTGTTNNNATYTVSNIAATTLTVTETPTDEGPFSADATLTINKIVASSGSFITDGFSAGDNLRALGTASCSNNKDFTITNVTATTINVSQTVTTQSATSNFVFLVAKYKPVSKARLTASGGRTLTFANITTARSVTFATATTITSGTGSFVTDGFAVGDKVLVSGTTYNNTTTNFLTVTAVATGTLTFANDYINTADGAVANAVLTVTKVTASSGSFITTEGVAVGDIMEVSGSANANNNKVFTVIGVTATVINVVETTATQATESSGALLDFKTYPLPRTVYTNANPALPVTFVKAESSASDSRIFTFSGYAKTITSSSGSFVSDGFVVGDKVIITGTTYNNKVTLTLTAVTATVLTATAVTERQYDEVSTTAVLTAYHIKREPGGTSSWATDGYITGDTITVSGTTSGTNDGTFNINNVTAQYLCLTGGLTTQSIYRSGVLITLNKRLPTRQQIYFTASRTFATTAASRTITSSAYSFLQDGYIVGDRILINGFSTAAPATTNANGIFTVSSMTATTFVVVESLGSANQAAISPVPVTWVHTGQRPLFTTTASITLVWTAGTKTLTIGSGTFDGTYNFKVGDKLFITGQKYNNGIFTIASLPGAPASTTLTVNEPVTVDTTTYNATAGTVSTVYGYHPTQKVTVTAAAGRTLTFDQTLMNVTASTGSFLFDGYAIGDCVQIAGTPSGINDGYFTICSLTATVMQFNEIVYTTSALSSDATISAPNIVDDTDYYYIMRMYDNTGDYGDSEEIYVKTTLQGINTNICLKGTAFTTTEWTASNITVGAATRLSPFVSTSATQTVDAIILTSTADAGTLTQSIPTAVDNAYTFSLWVCTQPTILKLATLTATASRTLKWDAKSVTRTVTFNSGAKTIVAGSGDFTTDFAIGDKIMVTGTVSNNTTYTIANVVALTITISETPVDEAGVSATIKAYKITAAGAAPGSFITDGYQVGDRILCAGTTNNNGWFTVTNVVATILNVAELTATEAAYTATATITNYFNDTMSIGGSISLGTATQSFTATALWQKVSVTFTATATTTNAVITMTNSRRVICVFGAKIDLGSTAKPYLTTTTVPVSNANEVRDINLVRAWCRAYGEAEMHSGIAIELATAVTGELWTEVYCGTTSNFAPSQRNKVFDTWGGTGYTFIFNQASQNNLVDGYSTADISGPINYALAYFAATSSGNKIFNLTYDFGGAMMLSTGGLASFNTQSNDTKFYNWSIRNWRNYATLPASTNPMIFGGAAAGGSNATSGLTIENLIFNNSDFPVQNLMLNAVIKGMNGGNVKPLNSALLYAMPINPVYVLGGGATNYDSLATSTPIVYTTVYDTIFNELYFTETTGALNIVFNASAKETKPYTLTGSATFSNNGRLYLTVAGDAIEYTWPHTILGVSGFRNVAPLLNGLDLGNTPSLLEGLQLQYKLDTGSGFPVGWTDLTAANLSAETVSATDGFGLKVKITAKKGMKYIACVKDFVQGETIRGLTSLATATVDKIDGFTTYGTLWLSNVVGTFAAGEIIVKDSNGEMRATNVATATVFGTFPVPTSYIDGLQIYTTVDQTALYPPEQQTLSLTGLKENSEVRIYSAGTTTELTGIENSTTQFDYEYTYSAGTYVDIVILHLDWNYYKISNYLLSSSDATLPIAQITDRVYSNT